MLVHARALLTTAPEGATAYVDADLRDVRAILEADAVHETLDLSRPVAVSLIAIMQFVTDEDEAHRIIDALMAPLSPGSVLAISTVTAHNPEAVAGARAYNARGIPAKARTDAEVADLFRGLVLLEPGVTLVNRWRPEKDSEIVNDDYVLMNGAVGFKP